jgi:U32 family peptidase
LQNRQPWFLEQGARFLRIEFLNDGPDAVERTILLYRETHSGDRDGKTLW